MCAGKFYSVIGGNCMKTQLMGQWYLNVSFIAYTFTTSDYGKNAIIPKAQSNSQQIHKKKEALFKW